MKHPKTLWLLVTLIAAASVAHATIRINGNQLMSTSYNFDAPSAATARTNAAPGAPRLIMSFGQGVMGRGTLPGVAARQAASGGKAFKIGIGLSYDIVNVALSGYTSCPILMTGDVNSNGSITSADIIYLVGYVFKGSAAPLPCQAAGDVNCNGSVTSADIIYLVGYVFKGSAPPCDVCTIIPGVWSCP